MNQDYLIVVMVLSNDTNNVTWVNEHILSTTGLILITMSELQVVMRAILVEVVLSEIVMEAMHTNHQHVLVSIHHSLSRNEKYCHSDGISRIITILLKMKATVITLMMDKYQLTV